VLVPPPAETAPAAPTEKVPTEKVPPPTTTAPAAEPLRYRRRVVRVLGVIVLALGAYWASSYVVAYTDDAYVTSDLIAVAPQVTGRVVAIHIVDNQAIAAGAPLATIDPLPFQLALKEKQAKRAEAAAQLPVDRDTLAAAQAMRDETVAKARLAADDLARARPLAASSDISRQALDAAVTRQQSAQAALADADAEIAKTRNVLALHEAAVAAIEAELAYVQWQLDQTKLVAPADGSINNLTLRVGDQADANKPLVGIVDAHSWRIIANFKEDVIRHLTVGQTAWVWLDAKPWRFQRAKVQGIARGIARDQTPNGLLPYVAPTTDWIRLQRRFPVTLTLTDPGPDLVLHMGADARVVAFY
jgi:multidrug efflux system membrane fusion protein